MSINVLFEHSKTYHTTSTTFGIPYLRNYQSSQSTSKKFIQFLSSQHLVKITDTYVTDYMTIERTAEERMLSPPEDY